MIFRNLIDYIPEFLKDIAEYREIFRVEDADFTVLFAYVENEKDNIFIQLADENTIVKWERLFRINPVGSLDQRRNTILALIRGSSKLNEQTIKNIVNAITGGKAQVQVDENVLSVFVLPPSRNYQIDFEDIRRALLPRIPAHLELVLERFYSTWGDIASLFNTWGNIYSEFETWDDLRNFVDNSV